MALREGEITFSLEAEVRDGRVSLETHSRHEVGYAATKKAMALVRSEIDRVLREGDEKCLFSIGKQSNPYPNQVVNKLWGSEVWHRNDEYYCMKTLTLKHGYQSSLHMHAKKRETFLVVSGVVLVEYGEGVFTLNCGDNISIEPGIWHRFKAVSTNGALVIEASTTHSDDDVQRREESRKT